MKTAHTYHISSVFQQPFSLSAITFSWWIPRCLDAEEYFMFFCIHCNKKSKQVQCLKNQTTCMALQLHAVGNYCGLLWKLLPYFYTSPGSQFAQHYSVWKGIELDFYLRSRKYIAEEVTEAQIHRNLAWIISES